MGFKIRTPVAPSLVTLFQTLKAAPLALQFPELYSALQTHIADGQENPLTLIKVAKFYEVQKYCSITNHVWDGHWFVLQCRGLEGAAGRSEDDRRAQSECGGGAGARGYRHGMTRSVQADLEKAGSGVQRGGDAELPGWAEGGRFL